MLTRRIPSSGEVLPVIGLGTYNAFDMRATDAAAWAEGREGLRAFVEGGGRVVDSSPMYGEAENAVGALAADLGVTGKLFLATKVWINGGDAGRAQMDASFRKLRAQRVDLMQVHNLLDVDTHLRTLADWKAQGRIKYIGVTHYTASAYDALEAVMKKHTLDFIQINYSAAELDAADRILPLAESKGMAVLANRPLAGGDLIGRLGSKPLPGWAGELGCKSWAQVLLKFAIANQAVTCAIPGTRKARHIRDNLEAGTGALPDNAMQALIREAVRQA